MSHDIVIYHNPRCSKSRETLALLQQHGVTPRVVMYLDTPPDAAQIRQLLSQLGFSSARELMRQKEALYRELNLSDSTLSETQLITALIEHPTLIERPIVINGERARIGRPPEQVLALL
ncbi:arsenate reductase (glutaredoxin) [Candidatus Symbiopectobacterium sp. NZEC151]|uniref:arsenate reductase (glutaredoxin) n=1 Tax=Candidatus Symbiopectobacterium sp. NZEC151 TaxID=2820470 RepID=UPI002226316E|nr:arsenate reductase (glutaredoxin) [Candidatus Symbiopectobacterium sp. NZEC151]MCW2474639.1 arsenate reductase (glutaredoxin) [Candidatus Symbiopectobacterium sp. NZEC151]